MAANASIDQETLSWVSAEIESTLTQAKASLDETVSSDGKDVTGLRMCANHLHQIVGTLQMVELKTLSAMVLQAEELADAVADNEVDKPFASTVDLLNRVLEQLSLSLDRLKQGLPALPVKIVELLNEIREMRGKEAVQISSLFSPDIDIYPTLTGGHKLTEQEYQVRVAQSRRLFHHKLLQWLKGVEEVKSMERIKYIFEKLFEISNFGSVARLWWVAQAYIDYLLLNNIESKRLHVRILRQLNDNLRALSQRGESALLTDPAEELVKIMLFYIGVSEQRSDSINQIRSAYNLKNYFPTADDSDLGGEIDIEADILHGIKKAAEIDMPNLMRMLAHYFDEEHEKKIDINVLQNKMLALANAARDTNADILANIADEIFYLVSRVEKQQIDDTEDASLQLAAALMYIDQALSTEQNLDKDWLINGKAKLKSLKIAAGLDVDDDDDDSVSDAERKQLLSIVSQEAETNLKYIEKRLEQYVRKDFDVELIADFPNRINQIRGALQIIGEQKVSLLLQLSGEQFKALIDKKTEPKADLLEALAVSVGATDAYVKGLLYGGKGQDELLDRSITDLELAIGKKITRDDVEGLLERSSSSMMDWLADVADYELQTKLRSDLRDISMLSKKTSLASVEHLVIEQTRLLDIVVSDAEFMSDEVENTFKDSMANISMQLIDLYGTEETEEEKRKEEELMQRKSAIQAGDDEKYSVKYHDDMNVDELTELLDGSAEAVNATELGKKHAVDTNEQPLIDEEIKEVFIEECRLVLQQAEQLYQVCNKDKKDKDSIHELRRQFHTLKGSGRMAGFTKIGEINWFAESIFNYILDTGKPITGQVLEFAKDVLELTKEHHAGRFDTQHTIDLKPWGDRADKIAVSALTGETDSSEIDVVEGNDVVLSDSSPLNDDGLREVFLNEANTNLQIIFNNLEKISSGETQVDHSLYVAIHTLGGNGRTLEMDKFASAYKMADDIVDCLREEKMDVPQKVTEILTKLAEETEQSLSALKAGQFEPILQNPKWEEFAKGLKQQMEAYEASCINASSPDKLEIEDTTIVNKSASADILDFEPLTLNEEEAEISVEIDVSDDKSSPDIEMDFSLSDEVTGSVLELDVDAVELELELEQIELNVEVPGEDIEPNDEAEVVYDPENVQKIKNLLPEGVDDLLNYEEDDSISKEKSNNGVDEGEEVSILEIATDIDADGSIVLEKEDDSEMEEIRTIFCDEARSVLTQFDSAVNELKVGDDTSSALNAIMRNLHTLKGSARMAGLDKIGDVAHKTEDFITDTLTNNDLKTAKQIKQAKTIMQEVHDGLLQSIDSVEQGKDAVFEPSLISSLASDLKATVVEKKQQSNEEVFELLTDVSEMELLEISEDEQTDDAEIGNSQKTVNTVSEQDSEIDEELLDIFCQEGQEILANLNQTLETWKSKQDWEQAQAAILRDLHTLKGSARMTGQNDMGNVIHALETLVEGAELKNAKQHNVLHKKVEEVHDLLLVNIQTLESRGQVQAHDELIEELENLSFSGSAKTAKKKSKKKTASTKVQNGSEQQVMQAVVTSKSADSAMGGVAQVANVGTNAGLTPQLAEAGVMRASPAMRIETATLNNLSNFVGDVSMTRAQLVDNMQGMKTTLDKLQGNVKSFNTQLRDLGIEADTQILARTKDKPQVTHSEEFDPLELDRYTKLQQLSRGLVESLDELTTIESNLGLFTHRAESTLQQQDRLNRDLQDQILQVRLVPFGGVAPQLRQIVRQTIKQLGKDVEFEVIGSDVRLDKSVLDGVTPALEHMLRNALDHGIESPEDRAKKGKDKAGKITIDCRQVAREILIRIVDDGKGLDLAKIRSKAEQQGLLEPDADMDGNKIMSLISASGFSTSDTVTQISGRGVGMDVVQTSLRGLSGSIQYEFNDDQPGSTFLLRLPISLAVTSAMYIQAGGREFAVSMRMIERVINLEVSQIRKLLAGETKPVIEDRGDKFTLVDMAQHLGLESTLPKENKVPVLLVYSGTQNIAVVIDKILDTQEIVVKPLGTHLGSIPIYSGATIHADGEVILILDLIGISYLESAGTLIKSEAAVEDKVVTAMVVDDSLTVRKAAQRDVSSLGVDVILAKDGMDAKEQLENVRPDIILLDLEMPRMDGFELMSWVRKESKMPDVPIVIISSRSAEKHIKKATDLGANHFLGKPYRFADLVETFNRFLDTNYQIKSED